MKFVMKPKIVIFKKISGESHRYLGIFLYMVYRIVPKKHTVSFYGRETICICQKLTGAFWFKKFTKKSHSAERIKKETPFLCLTSTFASINNL